MSNKNLLKIFRLGEGLQVEFKKQIPKLNRLAKTFSAFSNSSGGRVFIGVGDDGSTFPLVNPEGARELANQVAGFYCNPPIQIKSELLEVEPGSVVLVVEIEESDSKPVFAVDVNHPKDAWPYFRSDKENLPLDKKCLRAMRKTQATDLSEKYDELTRLEQQILNCIHRTPRQTIHQISRDANIGIQRTKKIVTEFEYNGWVFSFFNEKRREYSLTVPWKKK